MLLGDESADDGRIPVTEYRALRAAGLDADAYLAARGRLRAYAAQLPEDVRATALAALRARNGRHS